MTVAGSLLGRQQWATSATGNARASDLRRYYSVALPSITPGDFEFSLTLIRGSAPPVSLGAMVDSFSWADEGAVLGGSVSFREPDMYRLAVGRGQRIRCNTRVPGGKWFDLWSMRLLPPERAVESSSLTVELADDLDGARRSEHDWHFRKTKAKPHGWYCHEIAAHVCSTLGIKPGVFAKGTQRFALSRDGATGIDVLQAAYAKEKTFSGRHFVIRMRNGALDCITYQRNTTLYVIENQIQSALITQNTAARPATAIIGTAKIGKGAKAKKHTYKLAPTDVVKRFGYIEKEIHYGALDTLAELQDKVKRSLANQLRVIAAATVGVPGIPFIRRGDAAALVLDEPEFKGKNQIVFVGAARHTVDGGHYTSEFDISSRDPYLITLADEEKATRSKKRSTKASSSGNGKKIGASTFNDASGYHSDNLTTGKLAWAELGGGSEGGNLGNLPYNTKARITYKGKSAVGYKLDIGAGGGAVPDSTDPSAPDRRRDIDLHDRLAAEIGFPNPPSLGIDVVEFEVL